MSAITSARSSRESSARLRSRAASRAASNLGKEITAQRHAEGLLLPQERRLYLGGFARRPAGLDAARVVLAGVVKSLEAVRRPPVNDGMK
jgi:hypothetical protein